MPLFLVSSPKGLALVTSDSELDAKLDVINQSSVDASALSVTEIDLEGQSGQVLELVSFSTGLKL